MRVPSRTDLIAHRQREGVALLLGRHRCHAVVGHDGAVVREEDKRMRERERERKAWRKR
jgi:hypothetical protein